MEEAIDRLENLRAEYETALEATFEPQSYYDNYRSRLAAIEEAIRRLRG